MPYPIRPTPYDAGTDRSRRPCRAGRAIFAAALMASAALPAACGDNDALAPDAAPTPTPESVSAPSIAAATRLPRSFFIDPRLGSDNNAGTKAAPFKTLAHGLSLGIFGDTMRLAPGGYSAQTGERFTSAAQRVGVPGGVTIIGTLADDFSSQLVGAPGDSVGLDLKGGATVKNLVLTGFRTGVRAVKGAQTLRGVFLQQSKIGVDLRGTAQATLVGSTVLLPSLGSADGVDVTDQAKATLDSTVVTPGAANCNTAVYGVFASRSGQVVLKHAASLKNIAGIGVFLAHSSKATVTSSRIERDLASIGFCAPQPSILATDSTSLTIGSSTLASSGGIPDALGSVGLRSETRGPIVIQGSKLIGFRGAGIRGEDLFRLSVTNTTFQSNAIGLHMGFADVPIVTITGSTFTKDSLGIVGAGFRLRGTHVTNNFIGIRLTSALIDLGNAASPGNNVFTGNTATSVDFTEATAGAASAAGNTWQGSTQGSDASGHYPNHPKINGASPNGAGRNFLLPGGNPNYSIQM